jgi:hypothetical protein
MGMWIMTRIVEKLETVKPPPDEKKSGIIIKINHTTSDCQEKVSLYFQYVSNTLRKKCPH